MKRNTKSKGGRPSKPTEEKRDRVVTIKLTNAEYDDLHSRAKSAGVKLSEFVRHSAFRLTIVSRLTEEEKKIADGILNMSSDYNQGLVTFYQLKLHSAAKKLQAVVDKMFDILHKLRPNKETAYVCKSTQ